jgi:hypothetical protein
MGGQIKPLFHEEQSLRQPRLLILTAIPPVAMLLLAIWQVGLGHPWGKQPMSNASVVGWTIFLWLIYFRLITVKLITDVLPGELSVALRGLWRSDRISLAAVESVHAVTYDPVRDWGGYGVRSTSRGKAYIAGGNQAVELELKKGGVVLVGSQRPDELVRALAR